MKIAVHVHVFYPALWPEVRACLAHVAACVTRAALTVYATFPESDPATGAALRADALVDCAIPVGNYGYDVAPFFNVLDRLDLDCFDYVIKLHTKRDTPKCWVNFTPFEGGQWRRALLSFCATPEAARRTLAAFARRPRLGMVAARALIDPSGVGAGRHPERAAACVAALGLAPRGPVIVYGTMFMVRAALLKPVWRRVRQTDFSAPAAGREHEDFGLAGIWEGAFGMLVAAQGYAVSDGAGPETFDAVRMALRRLRLLFLRRASDAARRLLGDTRFTRTLLAFRRHCPRRGVCGTIRAVVKSRKDRG